MYIWTICAATIFWTNSDLLFGLDNISLLSLSPAHASIKGGSHLFSLPLWLFKRDLGGAMAFACGAPVRSRSGILRAFRKRSLCNSTKQMNLWLTGATVLVPVSRIEVHCIPYIVEFNSQLCCPHFTKETKIKLTNTKKEEEEARKYLWHANKGSSQKRRRERHRKTLQ